MFLCPGTVKKKKLKDENENELILKHTIKGSIIIKKITNI